MSARELDGNGWVEIKGNPISKVGVYQYLGKSIGLPGLEPDKLYNVLRPAEELSSKDAIDSFKLVPWIDEHTMLGEAFGTSPEEKGVEGVIGEDVYFEYPYLRANIKLFSDNLTESVESGKRDLSCGYRCEYELESGEFDGVTYDVVQRRIRGNHIASVGTGRMGKDVAVLDSSEKLTFSIDSEEFAMAGENEDKGKKAEDGDMTLEKLATMVGDMKKGLDECMSTVKDMKSAKDAEEEEAAKKKAEDEEKAKADEKKGEGMDAGVVAELQKEIATLKQENANLKTAQDAAPSLADMQKSLAEKEAIVGRLSPVIGAFDHSEMVDANAVAKYGVDKLSIACDEGTELTALNAFLQANPQPRVIATGEDAGEAMDEAEAYINGNEE